MYMRTVLAIEISHKRAVQVSSMQHLGSVTSEWRPLWAGSKGVKS
jgi:hypothetical protein